MDDWKLEIYLREIETLCSMALVATEDMSSKGLDTHRFWNQVQSFLSATANLSKLFWPDNFGSDETKQKAIARADELKKVLSVSDDSILKSRKFRNHFEHSDNRLDDFVESKNGFIDRNSSPPGGIVVNGVSAEKHPAAFRNFDNKNFIIFFRADSYDVQKISTEVLEVKRKTENLITRHT